MKSIRKLLAGGLVAGAALLSVASLSNADAAQGSGAHGDNAPRMFSKLGLTTEQRASIEAIMTAARPQMKTLHEQARVNHLKMMQTKPDDPNFGNVVAEVAQSNATLASQRTTQRAEVQTQMYAVLTPQQKTQLATLVAQWAAEPHHGHGPGGRGEWSRPGAGAAPGAAGPQTTAE